jgi:hypothetical protein
LEKEYLEKILAKLQKSYKQIDQRFVKEWMLEYMLASEKVEIRVRAYAYVVGNVYRQSKKEEKNSWKALEIMERQRKKVEKLQDNSEKIVEMIEIYLNQVKAYQTLAKNKIIT